MAAQQGRILLLLDMNGTLCYRSETAIPGIPAGRYVRHKYYYRRAGADEMLQALHDSGRYDIVVYSSMVMHNIKAALDVVLPHHQHLLMRILDKEMNKPDPAAVNFWDTIRDLDKVWDTLGHDRYGPHNTVLVDNEARKFQEHPRSGIVIPEFGAAEVVSGSTDTLRSLTTYLLALAEACSSGICSDDVREFMQKWPFAAGQQVPHAPAAAPAPASPPPLDAAFAGLSLQPANTPHAHAAKGDTIPSATTADTSAHGDGSDGGSSVVGPSLPSTSSLSTSSSSWQVSPGTSLHFSCLDGTRFVMTGNTLGRVINVSEPATPGLRIEPKMDYCRLIEEARAAGCDTIVTIEEARHRGSSGAGGGGGGRHHKGHSNGRGGGAGGSGGYHGRGHSTYNVGGGHGNYLGWWLRGHHERGHRYAIWGSRCGVSLRA